MHDLKDTERPIELQPAIRPAEMEQVYQLRYQAYRARRRIAPQSDERLCDPLDTSPFARTYALRQSGRLLGSIRSSYFHPADPSTSLFLSQWCDAKAIPEIAEARHGFIESSRFVMAPGNHDLPLDWLLRLLRCHLVNAEAAGARYFLTIVRRRHALFYRRQLLMRRILEVASPEGIDIDGAAILIFDRETQLEAVLERHETLRYDNEDVRQLAIPALLSRRSTPAPIRGR